MRWVYDGIQYTKDNTEGMPYEIRWYKYSLGAPSADEYSGVYWERFKTEGDQEFSIRFTPDSTKEIERFKVIVLFGVAPGFVAYDYLTEEEFSANPTDFYTVNNGEYIRCDAESVYDENITYYYRQVDTREILRSEGVAFTNDVEVPNQSVVDLFTALVIKCEDYSGTGWEPSYGNYLLYNELNRLIDESQANIKRRVRCELTLGDEPEDLAEANIKWTIP